VPAAAAGPADRVPGTLSVPGAAATARWAGAAVRAR
jgi:hypothetical protein